MTTLTVISVGALKEDYYAAAVREYEKRLGSYCRVENVNLKDERIPDEESAAAVAAALEKEGDRILAKIPAGACTVAFCVEGEEMDSPALARRVGQAVDRTGKVCFVIGSSHGLSPRVKRAADLRLSVSRLTFPHRLMRVLVLEAAYRSFAILGGSPYHK